MDENNFDIIFPWVRLFDLATETPVTRLSENSLRSAIKKRRTVKTARPYLLTYFTCRQHLDLAESTYGLATGPRLELSGVAF